MLKSDLRKNELNERTIEPKHSGINRVWVILSVLLIVITCAGTFSLYQPEGLNKNTGIIIRTPGGTLEFDDMFIYIIEQVGTYFSFGASRDTGIGYIFFFILTFFAYLFIRLFLTVLFCHRVNAVKMLILKHNKMPVCLCREALKVWQTILIYTAPFVLIYSLYIFIIIRYNNNLFFLLMLLFFIFYMAFDLTLVLYVLHFRIRDKIDYISVELHAYMITLFSKTYIRANKRKKKKRNWQNIK